MIYEKMNDKLRLKLDNLLAITPKFRLQDNFFLCNDSDGWTDGFVLDMTNINVETMKSKAFLKSRTKRGLQRYNLDKETCPKVSHIIPKHEQTTEVTDVSFDLSRKCAILYSEKNDVYFNPVYLKYFSEAYKYLSGSLELRVREPLDPISVYIGGNLIGLIMPIRPSEENI